MSADPAAALDAGAARARRLPRLPPRHSATNVLAGRGGATVRSVVRGERGGGRGEARRRTRNRLPGAAGRGGAFDGRLDQRDAGRSIAPAHLARAYAILGEAPGIDEVLALDAVHVGPDEPILTAKVHPTPGQSTDEPARLLDDIDRRLRDELPEIGEMSIDATAHRGPLGTGLPRAE